MERERGSIQKENVHSEVFSPIRSNSSKVATPLATPVVLQQCNDLLVLQECIILSEIEQRREEAQRHETSRAECEDIYSLLENEKLKHCETMLALEAEREKVEMALTEIDVLRKQLEREKATFEKAFGLAKSRAISDSSKAEQVLVKCTALETLCGKKDEELASKNRQIETLQRKMRHMRDTHRHELEELQLKIQQELYVAQTRQISTAARKKSSKRKQ